MKSSYRLQDIGITSDTKILIVYPHPDDETFGAAGLIQKAIKLGAKIKVICLTKGEASTLKHGLKEGDDLATVRQHELESVFKYLGVGDYEILNFGDGKVKEQQENIVQYLRPQISGFNILVTYEPSGIYGHPDHIATSKIVTELAKELNKKLIYTTIEGFTPPDEMLDMAEDKESVKPLKANFKLKLNLAEFIKKIKTMGLHKSQTNNEYSKREMLQFTLMMRYEYFFIAQ